MYVCLGGTWTITRTIKDHTFGVLELCFQSHFGYEICVRGAAIPPWIMIIKSLHMFNVLGGHQRTSQPSALWAPWLCGSSWWCRPCIKNDLIIFQLLSVTFYPSQPKSREWAICLCFVFCKLLSTALPHQSSSHNQNLSLPDNSVDTPT